MRLWLIGLSTMAMMTGCDKVGMGSDGHSGPSESSVGSTTTGDTLGGSGNLPPDTSTTTTGNPTTGNPTTGAGTGFDTEGCGSEDTAADPWGDEDGCGGGLPTQSPYDVGNGGNCWFQTDSWLASCEEEPCLDYDCHSPTLCDRVTFGECDDEPSGASDSGGEDGATTGAPVLEVDDPAALECILEALSNHLSFTYTITECDSPTTTTTYEVLSNGLVITTIEQSWGNLHDRHQEISTFNDEYDYASCLGAGVENWEKRSCVGMSDSGPCPVGPVSCPAE